MLLTVWLSHQFAHLDSAFINESILTFSFHIKNMSRTVSFAVSNPISINFMLLTSSLSFLCVILTTKNRDFPYGQTATILVLLIELLLSLIFLTTNLALFYIFFEAILIPMYLLIGIEGSRERKIRASYMFFFYTLVSSLLFLLGILYIYRVVGSLEYDYIFAYNFTETEQLILWLAFFLSFASKIPMYPFHIWLPEAHVEAPTVGSVILAGVLLKLGVYGMLRFSLVLFPYASLYFSPFVYLFSSIGIIYASLTAIRQTDLKRIIAYSSVAHMNLVTLGIFSFNNLGVEGSILQSLSHGFVAGGMFLLIGLLYDRYHSRFIYYYGGLVHMMPIYAIFLLVFTLANIALPGTSSFVGEFLLLTGIYKTSPFIAAIGSLGVILCGAYSLWLYNKMIFGNVKIDYSVKFSDLTLKEFLIVLPLFLLIFVVGIYPFFLTKFFSFLSTNLFFIVN
jgi:proton-translocating NADH-quinone oxidoreductase chain M